MREVPRDQILERARFENPWWKGPKVPSRYGEMTPRPYLHLFLPSVMSREVRRAVVLMGPRRVGKTVLIHHAV